MGDFDGDLQWAERPMPPKDMKSNGFGKFIPAQELRHWAWESFMNEGSPLYNYEHDHLQLANIGYLWTNRQLTKHGNEIAAMASIPKAQGNKWAQAMFNQQLREWFEDWFDDYPDFLIVVYAPVAWQMTDGQFCALIEHELLHCSFKTDEDGEQLLDGDERPIWAMRGHDVEEFVSIVARYGAGNAAGKTKQLVEAANRGPEIEPVDIRRCCGTCKS